LSEIKGRNRGPGIILDSTEEPSCRETLRSSSPLSASPSLPLRRCSIGPRRRRAI